MIIETYTDKYFNDIVELVGNFYDETIHLYDAGLDKKKLAYTIGELEVNNRGNAFLLIIDGKCQGLLAGIEPPSMLNTKRIFQELVWYVNKDYRKYGVMLLFNVQKLLRERGFDTMIMGVLEDSKPMKIKAFYERMGYKLFESQYIRSLNGK